MSVKVVGYYVDDGVKKEDAGTDDVFLVYENYREDIGNFLEGYAPVGQHFNLKDEGYLDECEKITKEEYKMLSEGFYTPKDYL